MRERNYVLSIKISYFLVPCLNVLHLLKTEAWKILYFYLFSVVFCTVILDKNGRIKNYITFVYTIV